MVALPVGNGVEAQATVTVKFFSAASVRFNAVLAEQALPPL